ncbi:MAG: Asp-tRNA(Asn)/Glu-tRNA(Gln) amidotransferase subunit GatA [Thermosulfidibacteraceae bacterium]|jgi:aspartyl-tRNA(Asn)/glutamyl-tRNA(Gln) amidotransferase subunit A
MELHRLTILEARNLLEKGEISPSELFGAFLARIEKVDPLIKAYITICEKEIEDIVEKRGKLYGIPIAVKDNICTRSIRTTCGSRILENFIPPYDATVISKLKKEGAVIIGKTNMDEFAMGSSTENSAFFATRNPWDLERVPGGSSGGSAASVAADLCVASLGSDTGGSIRQPASFCGVVGLKPTYGRVSRFGLVAFASSLDQIGPITKDVADCAYLFSIISGFDPLDSTSYPIESEDFTKYLGRGVKNLRVGIPEEYFALGVDREVKEVVLRAVELLSGEGVEVLEVKLPHTEYAIATYYIIASAEASSNLERYDGVKYGFRVGDYRNLDDMYVKTRTFGFGKEVKRRIMMGTFSLATGYYDAYFLRASKIRALIKRDFDEAFRKVDVIITPTAPTTAFKLGEKLEDPLTMYMSDVLTVPSSLAGLPAMNLPCGLDSNNLPVGLQIIAPLFREDLLFTVGYVLESLVPFERKEVPLGV